MLPGPPLIEALCVHLYLYCVFVLYIRMYVQYVINACAYQGQCDEFLYHC